MDRQELLKSKLLELSESLNNEHIEVSKWLIKNLIAFVEERKAIKFPKNIEKEIIEETLKKYDGHREATANELGISDRTLYRKIKKYKL